LPPATQGDPGAYRPSPASSAPAGTVRFSCGR
jgi:hypothetical protein